MALFGKKNDVVAIDIGSNSIKMVQLANNNGQYSLVRWAKENLAAETIVDGSIMNTGEVIDVIKKLTQSSSTKNVVVSVSGNAVIIKRITLQAMSMDELEEQIKWEAEQYIPFDINDVNIDVHILEGAHPDPSQMDVLLVAARRDLINENLSLLQQSGLTPAIVDVDAFALANMFKVNYPDLNEMGTVALVNVGHNSVNVHVLKDGISVFTRDLTSGGGAFTEELQRALTISYEEAEKLKVGDDENPITLEVEQILSTAADTLAGEIRSTLEFYLSTSTDGLIDRILLSGGAARTPRFSNTLYQQTKIPVEEADPFRNVLIDGPDITVDVLEDMASQFGIAVGLGMRAADGQVFGDNIGINLFPKRYSRRQQAIIDELQSVGFGLFLVFLLCFTINLAFGMQVDSVQSVNNELKSQIENNKKTVDKVKLLQSEKKLLEEKLNAIEDLKLKKIGPVRLLDELSINCPDKLQMTSLSETNGKVKLTGVAASSPDISKFMSQIEQSVFFDTVVLHTIEQVEQDGIKLKEFSITTDFLVPSIAENQDAKEKSKKGGRR
jgi:type IV pilus assembly protein PilM